MPATKCRDFASCLYERNVGGAQASILTYEPTGKLDMLTDGTYNREVVWAAQHMITLRDGKLQPNPPENADCVSPVIEKCKVMHV
jgi:hypothetical protein